METDNQGRAGNWVTLESGTHVFIPSGGTLEQAIAELDPSTRVPQFKEASSAGSEGVNLFKLGMTDPEYRSLGIKGGSSVYNDTVRELNKALSSGQGQVLLRGVNEKAASIPEQTKIAQWALSSLGYETKVTSPSKDAKGQTVARGVSGHQIKKVEGRSKERLITFYLGLSSD